MKFVRLAAVAATTLAAASAFAQSDPEVRAQLERVGRPKSRS